MLSVLAGASGAVYGRAVRTLALWLAAGQLTIAVLMLVAGMDPVAVAAVAAGGVASVAILLLATRFPPPRRWLLIGWIASAPLALHSNTFFNWFGSVYERERRRVIRPSDQRRGGGSGGYDRRMATEATQPPATAARATR